MHRSEDTAETMEDAKAGSGRDTRIDPVCGMKVERATARFKTEHAGQEYFFCCAGLHDEISGESGGRAGGAAKADGIGAGWDRNEAELGQRRIGVDRDARQASGATGALARPRPMQVRATGRDTAPTSARCALKCARSGRDRVRNAAWLWNRSRRRFAATKTEYTCPMHPEIVRAEPGNCPICGMALEPRTVTAAEEENPELRDMTRRFWISVVLTLRCWRLRWAACFGRELMADDLGELVPARRHGARSCPGSNFFSPRPSSSGAAGHSFSAAGRRSSIAAPTCSR